MIHQLTFLVHNCKTRMQKVHSVKCQEHVIFKRLHNQWCLGSLSYLDGSVRWDLFHDMVLKSACDDGSLVSISSWENVAEFSPVSNSDGLFLVCCGISPDNCWCCCDGFFLSDGSIVMKRDAKVKSSFGKLLKHTPHWDKISAPLLTANSSLLL